jgi:hypothetical protein
MPVNGRWWPLQHSRVALERAFSPESPMAFRVFPFYNLNASVGNKGTNNAEDVKVVQGLLNIIYSDARSKPKAEFQSKKLGITLGLPPLPNGVYDTNLLNYITLFQSYSPTLGQDGRIDPVPGGAAFDLELKTRAGKSYQLYMLNKTALFVSASAFLEFGDNNGIDFYAYLDGTPIYA